MEMMMIMMEMTMIMMGFDVENSSQHPQGWLLSIELKILIKVGCVVGWGARWKIDMVMYGVGWVQLGLNCNLQCWLLKMNVFWGPFRRGDDLIIWDNAMGLGIGLRMKIGMSNEKGRMNLVQIGPSWSKWWVRKPQIWNCTYWYRPQRMYPIVSNIFLSIGCKTQFNPKMDQRPHKPRLDWKKWLPKLTCDDHLPFNSHSMRD